MNKLLIIIFCLLSAPILAQHSNNQLKALLTECLGNAKAMETPQKGKAYYMKYQTRTLYKEAKIEPVISSVELLVTKEQSHYRSKEFNYYHDQEDAFTVLPLVKMIVWADSPAELLKQRDLSPLASFKEQALENSKLTLLKNTSSKKDRVLVRIEHEGELAKQVDYRYLVLELDTQHKNVVRTLFKYKEEYEVDKLEIIYNTIDLDYKANTPKGVRDLVLSKDRKLLPQYHNFKLIDNRSSK